MRYFISILLIIVLGFGAWEGYHLRKFTKKQTEYKEVLAEVNRVNYGLFNMQVWKDQALDIFTSRIEDFKINPAVYKDIEKELNKYLRSMYVEYISSGKLANTLIEEGEKQGKIPKMMAKILKNNVGEIVKGLNLHHQIPSYSKILAKEIKKNEPMLKGYLEEALKKMIFDPTAQAIADRRLPLYEKYGHTNLEATNTDLRERIKTLEVAINKKMNIVYAALFGAVLLCFVFYKVLRGELAIGIISLTSIVLLLLGVTMPMIDIDARLNAFRMNVLGSNISFDEQYMYYQSKSILDVTQTLIEGRGIDLKIVGFMILIFSVVVPFVKLVLSVLFMYSARVRKGKIAKAIIYNLGKWSMADVFVVAMFMAYIGFYGIISAQLGEIANNQNGYAVETLNYSRLSPGALFFTTYCILSIVTGILIRRWEQGAE